VLNLYRIWVLILKEVIIIKDIRFDKTTFFDLYIKNIMISIKEYYLLPETLATLDFTVLKDLDIDIFIANKKSIVFQRDEISMAFDLKTVFTVPIITPEN